MPPVCLAVVWAVWAVWTIKPTLKRNDEGPEFFRAFFLCRSHGRVMLAKKLPNYRLFFFAKIAFQLSL